MKSRQGYVYVIVLECILTRPAPIILESFGLIGSVQVEYHEASTVYV